MASAWGERDRGDDGPGAERWTECLEWRSGLCSRTRALRGAAAALALKI
jgi:hypothetical protein